jgi:hypothetical protein
MAADKMKMYNLHLFPCWYEEKHNTSFYAQLGFVGKTK